MSSGPASSAEREHPCCSIAPTTAHADSAVIADAERFVREQGYTAFPATTDTSRIVYGFLEPPVEDRRNELQPRAAQVCGDFAANSRIAVIFRGTGKHSGGSNPAISYARAIQVTRDGELRIVHQPVRFPAAGFDSLPPFGECRPLR